MGNVLCVPKGRKRRGSTEGAKDKKRATKSTRRNRRCQRSVEVDSHSFDVGDELLVQRNDNQLPTRDCSSERCRSITDSRTLSTDSLSVQSSSSDLTSVLSPRATCGVGEVSEVPDTCITVETVRVADLAVRVSPSKTQGVPENSPETINENGQTSFVQNIVDPQSIESDKVSIINESIILESTSTDSYRTTENVANGQSAHASKSLHSNTEALEIEYTKVHTDTDNSEKHTKMMGSVSVMKADLETAASKPLMHKIQESLEISEDPSAYIKETADKAMPIDTFHQEPDYDKMVPNETKISDTKLEMNITECGNSDDIKPTQKCNIVDIAYHGNGDTDKKYIDKLNRKDSELNDTIASVDLTIQTKTPNSGIRPARSNKSSHTNHHNGDVPGKRSPGSTKTNSDSQKRNNILKKQLIEAVKRNQELSVLHNKDKHVGLILRAKSFYREPIRKVSDFEVPELPPRLPDMPMELNTKTHVYKIPDVARNDAQKKITWRQTEYQSSIGGQAWVSRTPVFQPPIQPLGERVLDMFGSVDRMKRSWVIPECRQIETLKLEHCIYPGLYVYPHMRWRYIMDTTNKQDNTNKRRDSDKPRTNTVVSRHKSRAKAKSGGLTRWSRYDNLNNLHKDRH